jgi:hydroxymethylglutaryl-CoA reductase (NADPH)
VHTPAHVRPSADGRVPVPRDTDDDYTHEAARRRAEFVRKKTGASLEHVSSYSFDPAMLSGNVEHFVGVAQVPIGVAGPLLVDGEHAQGEFYVPLATAEGTLVASYNRGMRLLYEAGGVKTTILDDHMQRAPSFIFPSAREARAFGEWLTEHFDEIREVAESTTTSGKLKDIEQYSASRILYTRFNYTTGDAAGPEPHRQGDVRGLQVDRVGVPGHRALLPRVELRDRQEELAGQHAAHARQARRRRGDDPQRAAQPRDALGLRADVPRAAGVEPRRLHVGRQQQRRALGQRHHRDVHRHGPGRRQRRESSAAFVYVELRPNGDYYYSVTIPSLIVATYGGGTGLATQRECLELLGCYGKGGVRKFTEIVAATVLCGELSLGSAIVAEEWVEAHDLYGRNR